MKKSEFEIELIKSMEALFGKDKVQLIKTPQVDFCLWIKDSFGVATDYRDFEDRVWVFRYPDGPRESVFDVLGDYKTCLDTLVLQAEFIYKHVDKLKDTNDWANIYSVHGLNRDYYENRVIIYPSDRVIGDFRGFLHRSDGEVFLGDSISRLDCTINISYNSDKEVGVIACTWNTEINNPRSEWVTEAESLCQGVIVSDGKLLFEFSSDTYPIEDYVSELKSEERLLRDQVSCYWANDKLTSEEGFLWLTKAIMK